MVQFWFEEVPGKEPEIIANLPMVQVFYNSFQEDHSYNDTLSVSQSCMSHFLTVTCVKRKYICTPTLYKPRQSSPCLRYFRNGLGLGPKSSSTNEESIILGRQPFCSMLKAKKNDCIIMLLIHFHEYSMIGCDCQQIFRNVQNIGNFLVVSGYTSSVLWWL